MITLHDLFIGSFPVTQAFGVNYDTYSWIKDYRGISILGHNGVDFGYNGQEPILLNPFPKTSEVVCSFVGWDENGYGNWIRIWDKTQSCVILYAHLKSVDVTAGQTLRFQQQVGIGDSTGWSTGPHLHCGFYTVDSMGNKLNRDNGYDGFLNVLNKSNVTWQLLNPTAPAPITQPPAETCDPNWRIERDTNWNLYQDQVKKVTELQAIIAQKNVEFDAALKREREALISAVIEKVKTL